MPRGPKPLHTIELSRASYEQLTAIARLRNAPHLRVVRAKVLVAAYEHPDWSNEQIAKAMGCTSRMVRHWRQRWRADRSIEDRERAGAPRFFPLKRTRPDDGPGVHLAPGMR